MVAEARVVCSYMQLNALSVFLPTSSSSSISPTHTRAPGIDSVLSGPLYT